MAAAEPPADVLVVGGGPAGRALAAACADRGLRTDLLDPAPDRPWTATYGAWAAELPADLPAAVVAARVRGRAVARTEHHLGWDYAVLDVPALRAHLDARMAAGGVRVRAERAISVTGPGAVALAGGGTARAAVLVDAGGRHQPLDGAGPRRTAAEQTAYGLVVPVADVAALLGDGAALFMDWRPDHGETGPATFLYGVPLGGGHVLLEETSLARRPGLPLTVLQRRLRARLAHHGIAAPAGARAEKVAFPLDRARHGGRQALGFGAAAPLVHPASGFGVATALRLAPRVADALAAHLPARPAGTQCPGALAAAHAVVWSPSARAVHHFRRIGLEALLRMPGADVAEFFETFFALPERHRWSYLTGRDDLAGTVATMGALFGTAGWSMRRRLVLPALMRPAPPIR